MTTAAGENARTLAAALGIGEDEAAELLDATILVTVDETEGGRALAESLRALLVRTVGGVVWSTAEHASPTAEVIVGRAKKQSAAPGIWVQLDGRRATITREEPTSTAGDGRAHRILISLAACYATGAAVRLAVGDAIPFPANYPIRVDLDELLGADVDILDGETDIGTVYLAGAGAIGNGFLLGLAAFDVCGELHICDPDHVSDGNLNRCVWFTTDDLGEYKAQRLVLRAQSALAPLKLVPHEVRLDEVPEAKAGGAWLRRLVVGVDSRRARRNLQNEMAHEVFDASTTGIAEVVLHFHSLPTEDEACMSCIYHEAPDELAHEAHVAELLGVDVAEVRTNFVGPDAAHRIAERYPHLDAAAIVGLAYDSLFKQLCGQAALKTTADRQVLAPFGFVSALGGVVLAIELIRRIRKGEISRPFNYWRISPWTSPVLRLRVVRPSRPDCEFCSNDVLQTVVRQLWGGDEQ